MLELLPEQSAVRVGRRDVAVTPTEYRLLALFLGEPGRVFSRQELIREVIGGPVAERTVDVYVKELRRKLGPYGLQIETVRGRGYRYPS
jgi:two-component system phosphate regulon response regulator PhoB